MLRPHASQTLRTFFESRLVLMLLLLLAAFFIVGIGRELFRRYSLDQQFTDLEQTIAELEADNAELTGLISYFQSDTYQEEQARLKLGFASPGERAVTVPIGDAAEPETTTATQAAAATTESNVALWIDYFFL